MGYTKFKESIRIIKKNGGNIFPAFMQQSRTRNKSGFCFSY